MLGFEGLLFDRAEFTYGKTDPLTTPEHFWRTILPQTCVLACSWPGWILASLALSTFDTCKVISHHLINSTLELVNRTLQKLDFCKLVAEQMSHSHHKPEEPHILQTHIHKSSFVSRYLHTCQRNKNITGGEALTLPCHVPHSKSEIWCIQLSPFVHQYWFQKQPQCPPSQCLCIRNWPPLTKCRPYLTMNSTGLLIIVQPS